MTQFSADYYDVQTDATITKTANAWLFPAHSILGSDLTKYFSAGESVWYMTMTQNNGYSHDFFNSSSSIPIYPMAVSAFDDLPVLFVEHSAYKAYAKNPIGNLVSYAYDNSPSYLQATPKSIQDMVTNYAFVPNNSLMSSEIEIITNIPNMLKNSNGAGGTYFLNQFHNHMTSTTVDSVRTYTERGFWDPNPSNIKPYIVTTSANLETTETFGYNGGFGYFDKAATLYVSDLATGWTTRNVTEKTDGVLFQYDNTDDGVTKYTTINGRKYTDALVSDTVPVTIATPGSLLWNGVSNGEGGYFYTFNSYPAYKVGSALYSLIPIESNDSQAAQAFYKYENLANASDIRNGLVINPSNGRPVDIYNGLNLSNAYTYISHDDIVPVLMARDKFINDSALFDASQALFAMTPEIRDFPPKTLTTAHIIAVERADSANKPAVGTGLVRYADYVLTANGYGYDTGVNQSLFVNFANDHLMKSSREAKALYSADGSTFVRYYYEDSFMTGRLQTVTGHPLYSSYVGAAGVSVNTGNGSSIDYFAPSQAYFAKQYITAENGGPSLNPSVVSVLPGTTSVLTADAIGYDITVQSVAGFTVGSSVYVGGRKFKIMSIDANKLTLDTYPEQAYTGATVSQFDGSRDGYSYLVHEKTSFGNPHASRLDASSSKRVQGKRCGIYGYARYLIHDRRI
jgi:hypothetical protein